MTDSLQNSFQRIQISEDDFKNVESIEDKIPVLSKSTLASRHSQKLRDVSPICVIVVGMAGSGKTTLMAALQRSLGIPKDSGNLSEGDVSDAQNYQERTRSEPIGYCLNLDPATKLVPFGASIDIRDTVDYKVRKQIMLYNGIACST
jgi:GTPase SAR1 family protein